MKNDESNSVAALAIVVMLGCVAACCVYCAIAVFFLNGEAQPAPPAFRPVGQINIPPVETNVIGNTTFECTFYSITNVDVYCIRWARIRDGTNVYLHPVRTNVVFMGASRWSIPTKQ